MKKNHLGIMYGLCAGLFWSFTLVAPKVSPHFSSTELLLGRYFVFFCFSLIIFSPQKIISFIKKQPHLLKDAIVLSTIGFSGYYFILVEAVRRIGVPFPSFMMGMVPITMILFSGKFRINLSRYFVTIILGFSGMVILALNAQKSSHSMSLSYKDMYIGFFCSITALAFWTYYALRNIQFFKENPSVGQKEWASIIGVFAFPTTIMCLIVEGVFREPKFYVFEATTTELNIFVATIISIGLGSSWLATYFWNKAGAILSKEMLGQMIVSETCFAVILNAIYEKRMLSPSEILALILLSIGVAFAARQKHDI